MINKKAHLPRKGEPHWARCRGWHQHSKHQTRGHSTSRALQGRHSRGCQQHQRTCHPAYRRWRGQNLWPWEQNPRQCLQRESSRAWDPGALHQVNGMPPQPQLLSLSAAQPPSHCSAPSVLFCRIVLHPHTAPSQCAQIMHPHRHLHQCLMLFTCLWFIVLNFYWKTLKSKVLPPIFFFSYTKETHSPLGLNLFYGVLQFMNTIHFGSIQHAGLEMYMVSQIKSMLG